MESIDIYRAALTLPADWLSAIDEGNKQIASHRADWAIYYGILDSRAE